ncbi:MAG: amino acid adenylation domain-containing protein, partial [Thermoanaerobaculia bacterium]
ELTGAGALDEDLCRVRDSLRAIPRKGIGYGVLRYLARAPFRELPEVVFNYLGQFDDDVSGAWSFSDEPCGRSHAAALERGALVELETAVIGGRLRISASYNRRIHDRATIARFAEAFRAELLSLAAIGEEESLPLTTLQEGMLFHELEGRSAYFEQFLYRITGDLDVERFFACWRVLALRHAVLRTAIRADGERPMQVVLHDRTVETAFVRTTSDDAVSRFAEEDRARGFDLARDPLMRVAVLQTGPREYEVVWSHHHAILDGWSIGILQQELAALYDDPAAALPPAPQYRRYLEWLASRDQSASQRFWSSILEDPPAPSSIPNLGRANTFTLAEHVFTFDRDTTAALTELAMRLGATLNSVIQAFWSVLLAMYNGEQDVIFGAVVSGRPPELSGVERMVGLFLQTIPVRVRVEPDATFADLLAAIQQTALASVPHHHYPLTDMQLLTGVARPLFNHVLVFENYPLDGATGPRGLRIDNIRAHEEMHYDFSIVVHPGEELEVKFPVNANAVPLAQLAVIEEQFRSVVAAVLRDERIRIRDLDLASETAVEVAAPAAGNVLELFEVQARLTPEATAAEHDREQITYGALNARADELARAMDVGAGEIVPVLLPNSIEYIATILAIMKRGAVFAPIAPSQPQKRVDALRERLTGTLDGDAAYIMFTSGSTGEPKAIVGTHEGLNHFIAWERGEVGADASIRVSNLALTTFDASLRDIFLPLVTGGTVCIPPQKARGDAARLLRWLADARITHLHVVPSIFRLLLKEGGVPLPHLRCILFAGEALYGRDVQRIREAFGHDIALFNLYGPSETTLVKTCYRIPATFDDPARMVPVGKPFAGTRITLVKDDRPLARGAIGEVHIEPPFRCGGYLDGSNAGGFEDNVYRTGDLARELADGTIEFIGRRDRQVKVNGVRIELAEIDRALAASPEIELALAVAIPQPDGEQTLACYYTEQSPIDAETIRTRLRDTLPDWMIPGWFVRLDEFPLNANGKIDRNALPKPEELASGRIRYEAPANDVETRIAAIWAEVLGVPRVGVMSPFFEIGGNSLRAIRIIGRINRELGTALTIGSFFEHRTIRRLAASVLPASDEAITPLPKAEHYAVSHAQRRLWVLDQLGMQPHAYTLPAALLLEGKLDVDALRHALRMLVARHESLRTTFHELDGEPRQRIHEYVAFEVPLIEASDEEEAHDLVRAFIAQPFDMTTGPLFRAAIVRLWNDQHLLVAALHHIISDGWSIANMTAELAELYRGEARPPLRIHYKDFAAWQNALLESEAGRRARDYWHRQLAAPVDTLRLPLDRPRPAVQSFRGATVVRTIDVALADEVRRFSSANGGTLFMTLVAALNALLYRYTGEHDIVVGTAVSNRDREELEGQLGFYVNTLALRNQLQGDETFATLFRKVRDTVAGAIEHSLYPFDRLVHELEGPRELGRSPLFDVMIVLQDGVQPALTLGDVRASDLPLDWHTAKYTLSFELTEQPGGAIETRLEFDTDLFRPDTSERLATHFTMLLASAMHVPAAPIAALEMLTPAERCVLMAAAPSTDNDSETIVTAFERVAALHAERPAVIGEECVLTYDALNRRANQLAHALTNICDRGDFVAVLLDRSELLVIAFLGILKRGAVYVPIDPSYPAERITHMLEDSGARVILGRGGLDIESLCAGQDDANPELAAGPRDLAYVIYTSGSTGKPKGVLLEHDGAVALSEAHRSLGIEPRHRILQFAPSSFDASVWEILMALMHGAALVIATRERIADTRELTAYLREHCVTVATLPPSYLAQLGNDAVRSLELLITAGEPPVVEQALALSRNLRYINAYGPTETTVCATWHEVNPARDYGSVIPVGNAIPGAAVYVLDAHRNAVPFGATGEIYVGGRGVARGYHKRPDLTAQSFVDGLYRTGDLGYRLPNGDVVYVGRNDTQVKVRGHRVELGEIEQALVQCDDVRQAVVMTRDDDLVAYVVPHAVDVTALRAQLERRLPAAMIPSHWVRLHKLPLMPNGKVDRNRLPADGETHDTAPVAPRNDLERSIATAWQEVLRRTHIGIHDRFYEAGGDSIKAVRIVNRLRRDGFEVRMRDFLEVPTIAGLASRISLHDEPAVAMAHDVNVPLTAHELEGLFGHE